MTKTPWTDDIRDYWKNTNAFKKSIEQRSPDLKFTFFDGPPFTSGDPHYGHLLQSIVKDMVPRWMTMRGYRVPRTWGRDCHGIPAENFVNKKLGINSKKEIEEEFGIRNYIEECRTMVSEINDNWGSTIDKIGRWVDMDNAYFTMDNDFMESVIHVFSDLYHNGLIYKGFKVLGYSWALGTALSNSEIAEGYEMRQDPAVTVTFPLKQTLRPDGEPDQFVAGVIKDTAGRQLLLYHQNTGKWFYPGGKIEKEELPADAIKREIEEELGVSVVDEKFLGGVQIVQKGKLYKGHYFEIVIAGEPVNKEPETHTDMQWVEKIESNNEENTLGFALKIDAVVIDDAMQIEREFLDWYFLEDQSLFDERTMIDAPVNLLAWTTTPWTLPSNMFAAVNKQASYAQIFDFDTREYYLLAENLIAGYFKDPERFVVINRMPGTELLGMKYKPLFDYYHKHPEIPQSYKDQVHTILGGEFITTDSGTGIAHEAPAFGEDDYDLVCTVFPREKAQEWLFDPIDAYGDFTALVPEWEGVNVIESNKQIAQALKDAGRLYKLETIDHSYPHCPRTKTPLIYKAIESWFLKEDFLKAKTVPSTEGQYFVPETVKKRFTNGLASAPDWNISRTRFWGCPLPVWENKDDPDERVVVGSIAEIYELNKLVGQIEKKGDEYFYTDSGKLVDLHRPYIDDIVLIHPETGNKLHRIVEVLDCRFESGSMPYGQIHWMKNENTKNTAIPTADFIAEGLDQTRGWFRALHVLANAYIDKPVFQNVVVTGMILAEDGKKMSKSLKNYPDPNYLLDQYGADPLRLYLLGSPVVKAEPLRFNEQGVEQLLKDFVIPLQNVWNFLKTYAEVDQWSDDGTKIYYMRHAHCPHTEESPRTKDTPLSDEGVNQIESKHFLEIITRVDPDVILYSDHKRAVQTAQKAVDIMKKSGKDTDAVELQDLKWDEDSFEETYDGLKKQYAGKRILIVSHKMRWRIALGKLLGIDADMSNDAAQKEYPLGNIEVVPMPTHYVHSELDQWIYAELHTMMLELNEALDSYTLEPATRILTSFIEKLTNWYVRRSRRRFWAEGMEDDKANAYQTLWHVLETFLLCAAPFVPFVTEKIWLEMKAMQGDTDPQSIHLQYRPFAAQAYKNDTLIQEVEVVRKVIKGALYIRAKNKVKVKQPLQTLSFRV